MAKVYACAKDAAIAKSLTTHGGSKTPTWRSWSCMIHRCTNKKNIGFANYGGRGITVCDSWRKFDGFLRDMGWRPEGTSLDRIDPNGNYEPSNCRWASRIQQANNRRDNFILEMNGERLTLPEWARKTGIKLASLRTRIYQLGWPAEKALTSPIVRGGRTKVWLETGR
jgi:hypothetical protein